MITISQCLTKQRLISSLATSQLEVGCDSILLRSLSLKQCQLCCWRKRNHNKAYPETLKFPSRNNTQCLEDFIGQRKSYGQALYQYPSGTQSSQRQTMNIWDEQYRRLLYHKLTHLATSAQGPLLLNVSISILTSPFSILYQGLSVLHI